MATENVIAISLASRLGRARSFARAGNAFIARKRGPARANGPTLLCSQIEPHNAEVFAGLAVDLRVK
jgi:hypothetical protein